nr:suppressor of fused homolog isoform X1 [Chrysemys picta bellii]
MQVWGCNRAYQTHTGAAGVNPSLLAKEATPPRLCWACSSWRLDIKGSRAVQSGLTTGEEGGALLTPWGGTSALQDAEASQPEADPDYRLGTPQRENTFCSGDHVSWHSPLDNSESRIQHMLLTEDPQMQPVQTPFGVVNFLQIVGVCTEELHAAQQWNGQGILELLRTVPVAGGLWLITDMRRGETIFEIDPHLQQERVDKGIETDGSNLSGVSAKCAWDDLSRPPEDDEDSRSICIGTQPRRLSGKDTEQIRETLRRGLEINSKPVLPPINAQRQNGLNYDRAPSRKDSLESESSAAIIPHELIRTRQLESVHLKFNQESGALIPLCLRGRLLHGRHFTYKSITGDTAITFVSTGVEGAFATEEHPYAAHGPWLQILLTEEFVERMLEDLEDLTSPEEFKLPKEYSWPEKKLKVSILPDAVFDNPLH